MRSPDAPSMPERLRLTVRPIGRRDPIALFRRLQPGRWPFFLDSSLPDPELARYSFLGSDPIGWFRSRGPNAAYATTWGESSTHRNPLEAFGEFLDTLPWATAGTPAYPFLGGPVGYFAYDLGRQIERLSDEKPSDLRLPDMHFRNLCACVRPRPSVGRDVRDRTAHPDRVRASANPRRAVGTSRTAPDRTPRPGGIRPHHR